MTVEQPEAYTTPSAPEVYTSLTPPSDRPNTGKALFIAMLITGLILIVLIAVAVANEVQDNRAICERAVTIRDDNRAMWLAAFDAFPDSPEIQELRASLDDLLPPVTCPPGDTAVPREVTTLP